MAFLQLMRFIALFLVSLITLPANLLAVEAGQVVRLRGDARTDGAAAPLRVGSSIAVGDRLHTGPEARLEVRLSDGSDFTLGANADFTIDRLVIGERSGSALFHLTRGAFRMAGGMIAKLPDHRVEITAPLGVIGIRGTEVWGGSLISPLDVFLIEGEVTVTTPGGQVVLNRPNQGTSIPAAGASPEKPHEWRPDLRARAIATVSFKD